MDKKKLEPRNKQQQTSQSQLAQYGEPEKMANFHANAVRNVSIVNSFYNVKDGPNTDSTVPHQGVRNPNTNAW